MYIEKRLTKSAMAIVAALASGVGTRIEAAPKAAVLISATRPRVSLQRKNHGVAHLERVARRSASRHKRHTSSSTVAGSASAGRTRANATTIETGRSSFATLPQSAQEPRAGLGWTGRSTLPSAPPRLVMARVATQTDASAPQVVSAQTPTANGSTMATGRNNGEAVSNPDAVRVRAPDASTQPRVASHEPIQKLVAAPSSPVNPRASASVSASANSAATTATTSIAASSTPTATGSPSSASMAPSAASTAAAAIRTASTPRQAKARAASQSERGPATLSARQKDRDRLLLAQLDASLRRTQGRLDDANAELSQGQKLLASYGNVLRSAMLEAGPDARGLHPFVRVAQRYAGTPYVWGGESRNGFDCSGFIIVVMRDLGYKALPHSAAEQFNYGKPIAQALLKPGDIVFFKNTYKPGVSHVGIYLGHRRFIHAAGTKIGTIVSSLDSPRFQAHYAGARRLIAAR